MMGHHMCAGLGVWWCVWWRLGHGQSHLQADHDGPPYVTACVLFKTNTEGNTVIHSVTQHRMCCLKQNEALRWDLVDVTPRTYGLQKK